MVVKVGEKFEKTRHVKNIDKSIKYSLRGQRNPRYHQRILSNKKKFYNFIWKYIYTSFHAFVVNVLCQYNW